jgi:hypothetical protein
MALSWPAKDLGEKKDYSLDWTQYLAGDTIASSTWVVPTGIVQATPNPSNTTTSTTIWLSGGTVGKTYELQNTVTTVGGRTLVQSVDIPVVQK